MDGEGERKTQREKISLEIKGETKEFYGVCVFWWKSFSLHCFTIQSN